MGKRENGWHFGAGVVTILGSLCGSTIFRHHITGENSFG